jgi:uncharacterized protein YjbJ (UPF0337 family)
MDRSGRAMRPASSPPPAQAAKLGGVFTKCAISEKENRSASWTGIEGNWKQFKGRAKEKWGRLTDDDLDVINGRQDQLEGKIQERYGLAKDQAKKDVDDWFNSLT